MQRGRVKCRDDDCRSQLVRQTVVPLDFPIATEEPAKWDRPQSHDHLWLYESELAVEEGCACVDLVRARIPVLRRVTQHRVGHISCLPNQSHFHEELVEDASGAADKWAADPVFVLTGGFAEE
jgi:hypothetical protein